MARAGTVSVALLGHRRQPGTSSSPIAFRLTASTHLPTHKLIITLGNWRSRFERRSTSLGGGVFFFFWIQPVSGWGSGSESILVPLLAAALKSTSTPAGLLIMPILLATLRPLAKMGHAGKSQRVQKR
ncbi:hypothetical protein EDB83DRAFT_649756 [Lactarius deliciosus]|nr:hypothetical protein EDB83DRAFT_649756 [Lactarius deliciosus]